MNIFGTQMKEKMQDRMGGMMSAQEKDGEVSFPDLGGFHDVPSIPFRASGTSLREILAEPDRFRPLLDNKVGGVNFELNIGNV